MLLLYHAACSYKHELRMQNSLGLLPSGKLYYFIDEEAGGSKDEEGGDALLAVGGKFFANNRHSEWLIALAALASELPLPPTFQYWREFTGHYLSIRCHCTDRDVLKPIDDLEEAEAEHWLISAPPMLGAEYLSTEVLQSLWRELDDWLCGQVEQKYTGFSDFLEIVAPAWHRMGRVCFHLAENQNDPEYPFAFMATYSPDYGRTRSRHLPLTKALEQYSGQKNQHRLIQLLSPVNLAAESSGLIRDMVNSGEIYHPLAWSSQEAFQFLQEVPFLQKSGVVVPFTGLVEKTPQASDQGNFE